MGVRQTLRHLRSFGALGWTLIKNWRVVWQTHKQVQENVQFQRISELQSEVKACDDCGPGACEYHDQQLDELMQAHQNGEWGVDE